MSAGQAFVGIDAGTTGCTVMIFDENGKRLGQGYQEYPCTSPRAGWIEQDAEQVWDGICAASKAAVAAAALPASAYRSVGLSSQRGTILMLDENKNNLMPSVVWNDGRALKYQEEFGKEISPEDYQTHTGMQLSPLWSAAKIPGCGTTTRTCSGAPAGSPTARSTSSTAWAPTSGSPIRPR